MANWPQVHFGPPRKIGKNCRFFLYFSGPRKKWAQMAPNGARRIFFLLIQTLPTFWAERILILRIFIFWIFLELKFPDFWVPDFQISSLGPGLGPDAAAGAGAAGRILRSQPDPSPNAPRDQIRRKDPCCDQNQMALCKCWLIKKGRGST